MVGQDRPELRSWAGVRHSPPEKVRAMLRKGEHLNRQAITLFSPLLFLIGFYSVAQAALKLVIVLPLLLLRWYYRCASPRLAWL